MFQSEKRPRLVNGGITHNISDTEETISNIDSSAETAAKPAKNGDSKSTTETEHGESHSPTVSPDATTAAVKEEKCEEAMDTTTSTTEAVGSESAEKEEMDVKQEEEDNKDEKMIKSEEEEENKNITTEAAEEEVEDVKPTDLTTTTSNITATNAAADTKDEKVNHNSNVIKCSWSLLIELTFIIILFCVEYRIAF